MGIRMIDRNTVTKRWQHEKNKETNKQRGNIPGHHSASSSPPLAHKMYT
jgi:hypothetical protein